MLSQEMQEVIAIPLKYGSSTKPLKTSALAQLIAKALYLSPTPLSPEEVAKKTSELISKGISPNLIDRGINYLREDKKVCVAGGKCTLLADSKKEISESLGLYRRLQKRTISRLFPKNINKSVLSKWFDDASLMFFSHYSDEWVESVCKNSKHCFPKAKTLEELLAPSIAKYNLQSHSEFLVEGFLQFLSSDNEEDRLLMMNLGYAMFSARLVVSDIGADPITISELQNSKFILDTNFLIAVTLDNGRISTAIRAMGQAFRTINATLVILYETREEYKRVIAGIRGEVIGLLRQFPLEIVKDTDNDFIATAIKLGCKTEEDFERFFSGLELPKSLSDGPSISIEDDAEIKSVSEKAKNNEELKREIRKTSSRLRPPWMQKSETAISHDAALLEVGILLRNREAKTWVLSLDKVIQSCSLNQSAPSGLPLVLTADTIIHLLALNDAGPNLKSTDFAPLLSQMILRRCIPPVSTYTPLDLHMLHSINERAAELPPEKIKAILKSVTLARIQGKSADNEKLQQEVNRAFQEKKLELPKELQEEKERRQSAEKIAAEEKQSREKTEEILIQRDASKLFWKAVAKFAASTLFWASVVSAISWWVYQSTKSLTSINIVDKAGLISFVFIFFPIRSCWEKFQNERKSAYKVAKEAFYEKKK